MKDLLVRGEDRLVTISRGDEEQQIKVRLPNAFFTLAGRQIVLIKVNEMIFPVITSSRKGTLRPCIMVYKPGKSIHWDVKMPGPFDYDVKEIDPRLEKELEEKVASLPKDDELSEGVQTKMEKGAWWIPKQALSSSDAFAKFKKESNIDLADELNRLIREQIDGKKLKLVDMDGKQAYNFLKTYGLLFPDYEFPNPLDNRGFHVSPLAQRILVKKMIEKLGKKKASLILKFPKELKKHLDDAAPHLPKIEF